MPAVTNPREGKVRGCGESPVLKKRGGIAIVMPAVTGPPEGKVRGCGESPVLKQKGGRATVGKYTKMDQKNVFLKKLYQQMKICFFRERAIYNSTSSIRIDVCQPQIIAVFKESFTFSIFSFFLKKC